MLLLENGLDAVLTMAGSGEVCKIRLVQDSALSDHFNPLANYQAKFPTC